MKINLSEIRIDGGTQSRVEINQQVVEDYADAIKAGIRFPEVTLFFDGAAYWLVDGFHRYHAHRYAKKVAIDANAINGTKREAVLYAVGTNHDHGLRRSNEDKRKAVNTLLSDAEWSAWSDNAIAKQCAVSNHLVAGIRQSILENSKIEPVRTVERSGKTYQQNTANVGKKSTAAATATTPETTAVTPAPSKPKAESKPEPDHDNRLAAAIKEMDMALAENRDLQARIDALTVTDLAKKVDELVRANAHAVREKDMEMDKNAILLKRANDAERFRSEVVKISGSQNPKAAIQWVKSMAATQRQSA